MYKVILLLFVKENKCFTISYEKYKFMSNLPKAFFEVKIELKKYTEIIF